MRWLLLALFPVLWLSAVELPDIRSVAIDLTVPALEDGPPGAGKRVRLQLPAYVGTHLYHILYLPQNWTVGKKYPVLVEYAGNGPYRNKYGDISTGAVDDSVLGYGLSAGQDYIWLCLPYVNQAHNANQSLWWGDVDETITYCVNTIDEICENYGGDQSKLVLCGFSRGAIACNYLGLRNDSIAKRWKAFFCYSHYDGVRKWPYDDSDKESARVRLHRLGERPQFIISEVSTAATKEYLTTAYPVGKFTYVDLKFRNHNASWVLRPTAERIQARAWLQQVIE